jgi:hypothetical protein
MNQRGEKEVLTQAELHKVLQQHFRQFVAGVRFVVKPDGEVACEVEFAQRGLPLRVVGTRH